MATAIMGTAVAALLSLLSGSLGNIHRLEAPAQALLLGQSQMNELLAAGANSGDGTVTRMPLEQKIAGRWNEQFRWEAIATHYRPSAETRPGTTILARIEMDVFWRTGPGEPERKFSLETVQLWQEPTRTQQ